MGKEKSGKPGRIFYRIFQIFGNSILVPGTGTGTSTRFKVDLVFPGFPGFGSLTEKTKTEKK